MASIQNKTSVTSLPLYNVSNLPIQQTLTSTPAISRNPIFNEALSHLKHKHSKKIIRRQYFKNHQLLLRQTADEDDQQDQDKENQSPQHVSLTVSNSNNPVDKESHTQYLHYQQQILNHDEYIPELAMHTLVKLLQDNLVQYRGCNLLHHCLLISTYVPQPMLVNVWTHSRRAYLPYANSFQQWNTRSNNPVPLDQHWLVFPFLHNKHWSLLARRRWKVGDTYRHVFLFFNTSKNNRHKTLIQNAIKTSAIWNGYRTSSNEWITLCVTPQERVECGARILTYIDILQRTLEVVNYDHTKINHHIFKHYSPSEFHVKSRQWVHDCFASKWISPFLSDQIIKHYHTGTTSHTLTPLSHTTQQQNNNQSQHPTIATQKKRKRTRRGHKSTSLSNNKRIKLKSFSTI